MHTKVVTAEVKGLVKGIYENQMRRPRGYELIARDVLVSKEEKNP
ncbi:MAG: hypothetical protein ACI91R_000476 [Vicingaceae bacterium]|jgi:hypothetical protein